MLFKYNLKKMETYVQCHISIFLYTTLTFNSKLCHAVDSVCPKRKSQIVDGNVVFYTENLCCDNYEMAVNTCVECNPGFFRPDDLTPAKCIPCEEGTYGKKCAYTCTCHSDERCNSITGCVVKHDENTNVLTNESLQGISYGIAIGVIVIVICFCIYNVLVKKWNRISEIEIPSVNSLDIPFSNQTAEAFSRNQLAHFYDEVDETALNDLQQFQVIQIESDSDSKESSEVKSTEDEDGYLNPYNSVINSPQNRLYSTLNLAHN